MIVFPLQKNVFIQISSLNLVESSICSEICFEGGPFSNQISEQLDGPSELRLEILINTFFCNGWYKFFEGVLLLTVLDHDEGT